MRNEAGRWTALLRPSSQDLREKVRLDDDAGAALHDTLNMVEFELDACEEKSKDDLIKLQASYACYFQFARSCLEVASYTLSPL